MKFWINMTIGMVVVLTAIADFFFTRWMLSGLPGWLVPVHFVLVLPVASVIFFKIFNATVANYVFTYITGIPWIEKESNDVTDEVRTKCYAVLGAAEAIQHSYVDSCVKNDKRLYEYPDKIRHYMRINDGFNTALYCEKLENFLIAHTKLLLHIPECHNWFKQKGII